MRCRQQPLEARGIDHLRVDHERVAGVALLDEPITERGPESRHVGAHRVGSLFGRLLAGPDGVDQPVDRHDLSGVDHERGEQSPLPRTADRHLGAVVTQLDRAQDLDLHECHPDFWQISDILNLRSQRCNRPMVGG